MTALALKKSTDVARKLMTKNPVSINEHATLQEAAALLTDRQISAAPVINDAGRPVGVLSRTDLIRFMRSNSSRLQEATVRLAMTPEVLAVDLDASITDVCAKMRKAKIHRLFVVDGNGTLVGIISTLDVLRWLSHKAGVRKLGRL